MQDKENIFWSNENENKEQNIRTLFSWNNQEIKSLTEKGEIGELQMDISGTAEYEKSTRDFLKFQGDKPRDQERGNKQFHRKVGGGGDPFKKRTELQLSS